MNKNNHPDYEITPNVFLKLNLRIKYKNLSILLT